MSTPTEPAEIRPQPGPQEAFFTSGADQLVYGGSVGSGKSWALLAQPLIHCHLPEFECVLFRRSHPQLIQSGGLWKTSRKIYGGRGAEPRESLLDWRFPSGATIKFAHMDPREYEEEWKGAQIALIGFDQLEAFTWEEWTFMQSRNRSTCGIRPYMRATCNPDPDHWLRGFMDWWIDRETGYPIRERSGIVRYYVIDDDKEVWADTRRELKEKYGPDAGITSFTFIPGRVEDNQQLLRIDPGYLQKLKSMPRVERERLWMGNWNVRRVIGDWFQRTWFEVVDAHPVFVDCIRYWDRAATDAKSASKKSSWTVGVKMGKTAEGMYYVTDVVRFQGTALEVEKQIQTVASQDGHRVRVGIEQDPGQAGKAEAEGHVRRLAGYVAKTNTVREGKGMRAKPYSAQAEASNVKLLRGEWNRGYLDELQNFDASDTCIADQVDASSGAFFMLTSKKVAGTWGARG